MADFALGDIDIIAVLKILRPFHDAPFVKIPEQSVFFVFLSVGFQQ